MRRNSTPHTSGALPLIIFVCWLSVAVIQIGHTCVLFCSVLFCSVLFVVFPVCVSASSSCSHSPSPLRRMTSTGTSAALSAPLLLTLSSVDGCAGALFLDLVPCHFSLWRVHFVQMNLDGTENSAGNAVSRIVVKESLFEGCRALRARSC